MKPYLPEKLPNELSSLNWQNIAPILSQASRELAYYNGVLNSIINPAIFLSPLETREAVLSSRIEGTVTTVDEVLKYEVNLKPKNLSRENDIIEVINYRKATRSAKEWLQRGMPFNLTMICAIQKELIQGTRSRDKHPGEIRKEQVWIGPKDCPIERATYIAPEPLGLMNHLNNLVDYMNRTDQDVLIQTAIMHAQFEIIHPFYDGNGRTGRILIPLFLWKKKWISSIMFYISEYFDEQRDQYVNNLRLLSTHKDWERWLIFFLDAITVQAKRNSRKASQVVELFNEMRDRISRLTKSPHANKVLDALFIAPIMQTSNFIKLTGVPSQTAHRILALLKKEKILATIIGASGRTPEVLVFNKLFKLIR